MPKKNLIFLKKNRKIITFSVVFLILLFFVLVLPTNKVPFPLNLLNFYKYCPTKLGCEIVNAKTVYDNIETFKPIDVRTRSEYLKGHIPGSLSIPYEQIMLQDNFDFEENRKILIVCNSGIRSKVVAAHLKDLDYENIVSLKNGVSGWKYEFE